MSKTVTVETLINDLSRRQIRRDIPSANLIAAAPEMLEALVSAFHLITDGETLSKDHPWNKEATLLRIKNAVAKAEGHENE